MRRWIALMSALVAGEVALIAAVPVFVTVDGADHVGAAGALADLLIGRADFVRGFVTTSVLPATNLIPELPQALLGSVVGPGTAEKLVLAAYVVLLPASLWYAVGGVARRAAWLVVFALPLTFGITLHLGFYAFDYGLLGFLVVAGYYARHAEHLGRTQIAVVGALLTVTYACHAFVFSQAVLLLVVLEAWAWWHGAGRPVRDLLARELRIGLAALPGLLLAATVFTTPRAVGGPGGGLFAVNLVALAETLTAVHPLVSFDQREAVGAVLLAATLYALAAVAVRGRTAGPGGRSGGYLLFAALVLVELTFLSDSAYLSAGGAGGFLTTRLAIFPIFAALLWLASGSFGVRVRRAAMAAAVLSAAVLLAIRLPIYLRLGDHAAALNSLAGCVQEETTIAQVNLAYVDLPSRRTDPLTQEVGRLTAEVHGWNLGAAEPVDRVHLLRIRPGVDPNRYLRSSGTLPDETNPVIDPDAYRRETGVPVDYVLLAGRPAAETLTLQSASWSLLQRELAAGYRRVASVDDGWFELYERNGVAPGSPAGCP